eukprot:3816676-Prymnesium_polylepis.2
MSRRGRCISTSLHSTISYRLSGSASPGVARSTCWNGANAAPVPLSFSSIVGRRRCAKAMAV